MALPVHLTAKALDDIDNCRQWWAEHRSAEQAERWHRACDAALDSLSERAARSSGPREPQGACRSSPIGIWRRAETHASTGVYDSSG